MPNFHVHWLVAAQCIGTAPDAVARGFRSYRERSGAYRKDLLDILRTVRGNAQLESARMSVSRLRDRWAHASLGPESQDETVFSAYMLGACGPDFWTLPVSGGAMPWVASAHFDLGHYNRTHVQFEKSVEAVGGGRDLQSLVEQAYFAGMATHFATDLVIHQLVNVSAGAYNLQPKPWRNEQPRGNSVWVNIWKELIVKGLPSLVIPGWPFPPNWRPFVDDNAGNTLGLWSTHNKVEHYWDSYVRHRYLGDTGPLFGARDATNWNGFKPLRLPTCEGLWRELGREQGRAPSPAVASLLKEPEVMFAVEKPLTFPWLFCERVRSRSIKPFIYDRVVHKDLSAYPSSIVPEAAVEEKKHDQMMPDLANFGGIPSEVRRLEFFASSKNDGNSDPYTWNYLNYFMCPSVERLVANGDDVFYHLGALAPFVATASRVATTFLNELQGAYAQGKKQRPVRIRGALGRFWNLDTGLGIRVQRVPTDTHHDVITRIDLVHVLEASHQALHYSREVPWKTKVGHTEFTFPDERAFTFRNEQQAFASLASISEPDDKAYMDCIRLTEEARRRVMGVAPVAYAEYWNAQTAGHACVVEIPSASLTTQVPTVQLLDLGHRLTLQFRAAIADLEGALASGPSSPGEQLAFFAVADKEKKLDGACTDSAHAWTEEYWVKRKGVVVDHVQDPDSTAGRLQYFSTRVLLGFETDREQERVVDPAGWNNGVHPHEIGRNLSVGTGRPWVLHPTVSPLAIPKQEGKSTGAEFDPKTQYETYSDPSPTEQVFFTVYPIVRTRNGHFDLISKKKVDVSEDGLKKLKRIDSVGFVKIVLLYDLSARGAVQLDRCFVDGVEVPVETV